jgi:beta-glucanase (GH16 family)
MLWAMKWSLILVSLCVPVIAADWKLVWQDEFDGSGAPDAEKWTYEEGYIRNREAQFYTRRRENVRVENGVLVLEARRESIPNPAFQAGSTSWQRSRETSEYTSASVRTLDRSHWRYGRIEVRAKLPSGRGTWPAIWMLGVNCKEVGWPECGEIDIMENVGYDPSAIHANIHTGSYNHVKKTGKGSKITVERPWEKFYVYALEWSPEKLDFFVDGRKYFTYANDNSGVASWPYDKPFYLILNLAIGGAWGGRNGIDDAIFPQRMEVEYVRVYERSSS